MRPKKEEPMVAINCRIPRDVHTEMNELLKVTKKSAAAFVADAVIQYIKLLPTAEDPTKQLTKAMLIDRFAYQLHQK